jgi:HD-GYP domain-containing protein (c-di-GMP phosphodiesterase class II)
VADTFDAITTERPYTSPVTYQDAYIEISRVKGKQLCPEVCEAFLDLTHKIEERMEKVNLEIKQRNKLNR